MSDSRDWWRSLGRRVLALGAGFTVLVGGCLWATNGNGRGISPRLYGTPREVGTHGDSPNPRALFLGDYPSDNETQERRVGATPVRFSGYTTWVRSFTRVPARKYVDGYRGSYLRLHVTVFNRDKEPQHVCACDFSVWTRAAGLREADVVKAPTLTPDIDMQSGARLDGDVYLYVGSVRGPYYVVYDPDARVFLSASSATGVWKVAA